jgi:hypothetical protein
MTGNFKQDLIEKGNKTAKKMYKLALVCLALLVFLAFILLTGEDEVSNSTLYVGAGIFAWLIIATIINYRKAASGNIFKKVEKFCADTPNPAATLTCLEQTWRDGFDIGIGKIDPAYIIAIFDFKLDIIQLENVAEASKYAGMTTFQGASPVVRGNIKTYSVEFRLKDGGRKSLNLGLNQNAVNAIIDYIKQNCPEIVVGD